MECICIFCNENLDGKNVHVNQCGHTFCFSCASTTWCQDTEHCPFCSTGYTECKEIQEDSTLEDGEIQEEAGAEAEEHSSNEDETSEDESYARTEDLAYETIRQIQSTLLSNGHDMADILGYFIGVRCDDGSFNEKQQQIHSDYSDLLESWRQENM